ncbi:MAG: HAD family phosphatase [Lentisphaerota bacterium]
MLKAVLFDFDGVMVDSEFYHYRAYQEVLKPTGHDYTWDDYVSYFIGFDDRDAFRAAYSRVGHPLHDEHLRSLIAAKAAAFQRMVEKEGITPYPGVVSLVRALSAKYAVGLCSGALNSDVQPVIKALDLAGCIHEIITAEQVAGSKPDPECYTLCVARLAAHFPERDIKPSNAVAIEDTPAGIQSARAAGLKVMSVTNSYSADKLHEATRVVASLEGITAQDLQLLIEDSP